ncbi:MAG: glycosyltransferase family 4 protein [Chloroflexota bacterium]
MTRVLMISRCVPWPLHLGDRLIVYHVARELHAMGVTVDLIAFAEESSDWSLGEQQHYNSYFNEMTLFDARPRPTSELLRRALLPGARFPSEAAHSFVPEAWRAIERQVAMVDYDAVHLFGGVQVYEFAVSLNSVRTVITPYESYALLLRRSIAAGEGGIGARARLWTARRYEGFMYAPYDVVTVLSEQDRDELLSFNPGYDVRVIPNGIDIGRFPRVSTERDSSHLLFLGNYDYGPNTDAALWLARDIFPRVLTAHPDARLTLVGNAPPPELQALSDDRIAVTGRVPDVRDYLNRATVFVCGLRYGAGIKNKVLEALASGCPVVATPLSVDGIDVVDGESVLLADDAAAIAAATGRVLSDGELASRLRDNGRRVIEDGYTWGAVARAYAALYE